MLSHSSFYDINVGKGFSFLVIGKNICRLHCRYHFVLAAIFSSPKEIWFIIGLRRNRLVNSGTRRKIEKRISCFV
ncbi:hypothetical protein BT10792_27095 [Bacillus thuringiensis]|nr:hypothetical protein BT10792_27095 [Bacillus thuringiensis]